MLFVNDHNTCILSTFDFTRKFFEHCISRAKTPRDNAYSVLYNGRQSTKTADRSNVRVWLWKAERESEMVRVRVVRINNNISPVSE